MKAVKRLLVALLALGTALFAASELSTPANSAPYYSPAARQCLLIAHMGGDKLWPGDTRYAYDQAARLGVDVFDMDVHITRDGVIVLMHDDTLSRTTGAPGEVEDFSYSELEGLDAARDWTPDKGATYPYRGKGIKVTRLEDLFVAYPDMRYLIEIKNSKNPIARPLADLIHRYSMQRKVIVASFHDGLLNEFRRAAPDVATSASRKEVTTFVLLSKIGLSGLISPRYQALQVPYDSKESLGIRILSPGFIRAAHAKNLRVETWTLDDPALMKKYISWGIDGIDTDKPDVLKAVLSGL
ncbi:MAG TPA: glycerophosphodiester phosphodiesterase [Rectinemataceae bacterium]|nr:glycerophosphodiester phosphodiesterase [Rectinemataceae bacterium]